MKPRHLLIPSILIILGTFVFLFFEAYYGGLKFRTMQDDLHSLQGIDLNGLRKIRASGGNQPRFNYLTWKLNNVKEEIIILDLQREFHGYIYNIPVSFFGYNDHSPSLQHRLRRLLVLGSTQINPKLISTEESEALKNGFSYVRVEIGKRFIAPDEKIDELVDLFDRVNEKTWLHIHCTNGEGRTSTALVMLDSLKNAPDVTLANIVKRQHLLGSVNLFDTTRWKGGRYTTKELKNRKQLIEKFYKFASQRKNGGIQKWSDWNKKYIIEPSSQPIS